MIYCNNCNIHFDETEAEYETNVVSWGMGLVTEQKQTICPHCKSTDVDTGLSLKECERRINYEP